MNPAWAPAIISGVSAIFVAGAWWTTVNNHTKRLDEHQMKIDDLGNRMTAAESWRAGYEAAKSK